MKKTVLSISILALAMGMNSCSNDNETANTSSQYITVSTEIGTMKRVATAANGTQTFTEGDQISIYAWTGNAETVPAAGNRVVDNAINTLTAGKWVAVPQMLWKNTTDNHYFIGVYPKTETSVSDLTAGFYTLDVDNQEKSDLLVATNIRGLKSESNPVLLTFEHMMAKLKVSLQFRNQWGGTPTVASVTLKDAATTATVNYLTQTVTASATTTGLVLPVTDANIAYSSIVIPQTGVKSIVINIDGRNYTYTNPNGILLESGKITSIGLIVGRDEITLGEVSINDWQEGATISGGEAES
jgi:hypothetical protein